MLMARRRAFEVATWPCSEEYMKDQSIVRPAFELLVGSEERWGLTEIFYGIEVEKPNAYAVLNWESIAAHERFSSDEESMSRFVKLFESSAEGGIPKGTLIHAAWEEDAAVPCLKAAFVELRTISPRSGVTMEAIHGALEKYIAYMNDSSSGAVGATYGHVVEKPDEYLLLVGWESIEARKDSLGLTSGKEIVREIEEAAEEVIKVSLTQFSSWSCSGGKGCCYERVS